MSGDLYVGRFWSALPDGRVLCELCPRACNLKEGQRAFCFVRQNVGGEMVLTTYGRSTGFCLDPIEKKPLNHFYPGSAILSFGTAGCNLGCKFCQNWTSTKARQWDDAADPVPPNAVARAAVESGAASVAFTYNDPIIFAEYAIDVAAECRALGIKTVAVTNGYITDRARPEFFAAMDGANVDLKAFTEDFYHKLTSGHLQPVLDTLRYLHEETDVWFEVTTLVIPGHNDLDDDLHRQFDWFVRTLGSEVPLHLTAFHPDFRMRDLPRTPASTLQRARELALQHGLRHVYTGNVHDFESQSTYCAGCGALLIERNWYELGAYRLVDGGCPECGKQLAGRFAANKGRWGSRRQPVAIR